MAAPRKYPDELRERAVRLAMDQAEEGNGRAVFRRVGEQLGINPETLRGWVRQAQIDEGQRPGTTTSDAQGLRELLLLPAEMTVPALHPDPPAISDCLISQDSLH